MKRCGLWRRNIHGNADMLRGYSELSPLGFMELAWRRRSCFSGKYKLLASTHIKHRSQHECAESLTYLGTSKKLGLGMCLRKRSHGKRRYLTLARLLSQHQSQLLWLSINGQTEDYRLLKRVVHKQNGHVLCSLQKPRLNHRPESVNWPE